MHMDKIVQQVQRRQCSLFSFFGFYRRYCSNVIFNINDTYFLSLSILVVSRVRYYFIIYSDALYIL